MPKQKKTTEQKRGEWPTIYVEIGNGGESWLQRPKMARAQIKSRLIGNREIRYLSFRDGEKVRNLYLGSCTPHEPTNGGKKK
jgi:hypothetical protein